MANFITDEKYDELLGKLEQTYIAFSKKEHRGVINSELWNGTIGLKFGKGEAVESVRVEIDYRNGGYQIVVGSWRALTEAARAAIESKRFDYVEAAVSYAVATFNKINDFFKQF